MSTIPVFLRKLVIRRAKNRCEYCHLSQKGQEATFHIDHIKPVVSGGETIAKIWLWRVFRVRYAKAPKQKQLILKQNRKFRYFTRVLMIGTNILNGTEFYLKV